MRAKAVSAREILSKNLKRLMEERRLSSAALGRMADISQKNAYDTAKGNTGATVDTLEKIARALGFKPWELLLPNPGTAAAMTQVQVKSFSISLDGYGAGPNQDIDNPLGVGGTELHQWLFSTRTFQQRVRGSDDGTTGIDDDFAERGFGKVGAWIIGRNMFGPIRGPWPDMDWKGWWGDNPPYHVPVFVLTHHARPSFQMEGDTTFHFVTDGIHEALAQAREAANGKDIRIGGGPNVIQQYLRAGLIDELHIAIAPVLLGQGERLFEGVDLRALGYECVQHVASERAFHVVLRRQSH